MNFILSIFSDNLLALDQEEIKGNSILFYQYKNRRFNIYQMLKRRCYHQAVVKYFLGSNFARI